MWKPWIIEKLISKGDYTYAVVRGHPYASKFGYVLQHRIVMENRLKRILLPTEIVHHKNHKKKDCRPSNLELHTVSTHAKLHAAEKGRKWVELCCPACKEIFRKPRNTTHLNKPSKYGVTCCSRECRGYFYRRIQLYGLTPRVLKAIQRNVRKTYRKFGPIG